MSAISANRVVISFLAILSLSPALLAQSTPRESLLILSKSEHTLAIVDAASLKVLTRIPVGNDPHEVSASSDGKTAYVSNYGGGKFNTLTAIDLIAQKPLATIDLGALRGPHGLDFVGGKVWFTAEAADAIGSYDPASNKVDWILGTGQNRTHMIYVTQDLQRIVATSVNSATVSIIEKSGSGNPSGWNQTVIPVGKGSEGFDVSPGGKEIWVANAQDGTVSIIDFAQKKVAQTVNANVRGANRLKFTPDGNLVFVSTLAGPDVIVLDAATRREVKRIPVGHGAAGIQMQPDGSRAFVSCTPDDYVVAIDLKSLQVTAHIDAGKNPDGLAWAIQR
jgi:YVTN family beta-propeller protein